MRPGDRFATSSGNGTPGLAGKVGPHSTVEKLFLQSGTEPVDERAFDPEVWDNVKGIVEAEDWARIASQVAILVADRVRIWAEHPKDRNEGDLVGKGLYAVVFTDDSEYRLGPRASLPDHHRRAAVTFPE